MRRIFVTGIGTGIGKTVTSAVLTEKLQADYWKPVQSGELDESDTMRVRALVSNDRSIFHPEAYRLIEPLSPHESARIDGVTIQPERMVMPQTDNHLIIEGAGGLMVPLNDTFLMIDLIQQLQAEVVLVSANYLGSINHTLLSTEALQQRKIPVTGIIFNGDSNPASEKYILNYTKLQCLGRIPQAETLDKSFVIKQAQAISI